MPKDTISQEEFDKCVEEWKNMDRTTEDAVKDVFAFYDDHVFPKVKKVFLSKQENRVEQKYDALILTVGMSPEPLILSILATKPVRVGLLYTQQTEKYLPRIQEETELTLAQLDKREIDGSNTIEMYKAIMALYTSWKNPVKIAVDITGGKKSMVSGAAMAGAVLGADIYYIDTDNYRQDLGKPEPGTERLNLLENPYTVFGDLEVEKAKSLYKVHDYASAKRVFQYLKGQVSAPNQEKVYEAYQYLCTSYEDWDNLDTGKAHSVVEKLLNILTKFGSLDGLRDLCNYQDCLEKQKEALKCLQGFIKKPQLALKSPDGFHFAFTLYHNALRREAQGKLDMACLILYRLLEWIEQHCLDKYCINTKNPDYSKSGKTKSELLCLYNKKRKEVFPKNADGSDTQDMPELPSKIALVDGFLILGALENDIVKGLNWGNFRNRVDTRNQNIFAHGMKKIVSKDYYKFKSTVEERFEKAQEIAGIDADEFNKQHKFIAPLP